MRCRPASELLANFAAAIAAALATAGMGSYANGQEPQPDERWQPLLKQAANFDRPSGRSFVEGKRLYEDAKCVACHRMDGQGREFGPDLAKLSQDWTAPKILEKIVSPSSEINREFRSHTFQLTSGETVRGLLIAAGRDHVRIIEDPLNSTQPRKIYFDDIETRFRSSISLMPTGLLDHLDNGEVLDLLAYVYARGNASHVVFREPRK